MWLLNAASYSNPNSSRWKSVCRCGATRLLRVLLSAHHDTPDVSVPSVLSRMTPSKHCWLYISSCGLESALLSCNLLGVNYVLALTIVVTTLLLRTWMYFNACVPNPTPCIEPG